MSDCDAMCTLFIVTFVLISFLLSIAWIPEQSYSVREHQLKMYDINAASKVKHHPNIFSVSVFMYAFLQKNNT